MTTPIMLEIDGEGLEPETVDPLMALELAGRYFDLLQRSAANHDIDLALKGLKVVNKCVGVEVTTSSSAGDVKLAVMVAGEAIGGGRRLPGTSDRVKRLRKLLLTVPQAKVRLGDWSQPISPDAVAAKMYSEITSLRVHVLRVGGVEPTARFSSPFEIKNFTLSLRDESFAKRVSEHLYDDIDMVARITRNQDGLIVDGLVESFTPLDDGDSFDLWRDWYRAAASEWDGVEDIEGELGRGDDR